jgi:hypothetical protein
MGDKEMNGKEKTNGDTHPATIAQGATIESRAPAPDGSSFDSKAGQAASSARGCTRL